MSYSYKQWSADQTADNVIHASDLERWQDGITDAGGTWEGSWTDEKDTLTADQLNALETEIASLYGTGFTAKTWEDGQVPGVDEWNRIEDAINTILNRTAFAIYCETDNSLMFYVDVDVPSVGDTYDGKVVANVWTGIEDTNWSSDDSQFWYDVRKDILSVVIDRSFGLCRPASFRRYFNGVSNATFTGLEYINTSKATTLERIFCNCYLFNSIDSLINWDISNVTNMSYMFYGCTGLTSVDEITTKWDFSNVTNIAQMFNSCSQLTTIDISKMNTAKVTNMSYLFASDYALTTIYSDDDVFVTTAVTNGTGMFSTCRALVGGNGTTYDSSKTDASMAHIDTEDNPGYFTKKE